MEFTTNVLTNAVVSALPHEQLLELAEATKDLHLGLSSAGMLRWGALVADGTPASDYDGYTPSDAGDLGRCTAAYEAAPAWLKVRITDLYTSWVTKVAEKNAAAEQARSKSVATERATTEAEAANKRTKWAAAPRVQLDLSPMELDITANALTSYYEAVEDELLYASDDEDIDDAPYYEGYTLAEVGDLAVRLTRLQASSNTVA